MNKYLLDLAYSFQKVSIDNYKWDALSNSRPDYRQEAENNFTSEIVRHFRNLMEEPINIPYYKERGLRCNFDVMKARVGIKPDIVLHELPNNQEKQEILAEVKITDVVLTEDLRKLKMAISKELKFKYAVMIVANKPLDKTEEEIMEFIYKEELEKDSLKKLYLFHSIINSDDKTLNYTFTDFMNLIQCSK